MSEEPGTLQSRCQGAWAGREQSSTPEGSHLGWEGQVLPRNRGHRGWDWRCETNRLRGIGTMSTQPTHGCSQWVQEKPSTHHSLVWGLQTQGSLGPKKPELQLGERGAWWSMCSVTQSCPTLRDPMDCSPPASFVHGIFPASIPDPVRRYELIWKRTEPTRKRSWNEGLRQRETWPNPEWDYCCWEADLRVWAGSREQGQRSCHRYGDARAGSDASADPSGLQGLLSEALEHILERQSESWRLGT